MVETILDLERIYNNFYFIALWKETLLDLTYRCIDAITPRPRRLVFIRSFIIDIIKNGGNVQA